MVFSDLSRAVDAAIGQFSGLLERGLPRLQNLSAIDVPVAPGKWTPKEILGHLIDSASNNHQRFVRGQLESMPLYLSYHQDQWLKVGGYNQHTWTELVSLWETYNRHLLHLMTHVDRDRLEQLFFVLEREGDMWKHHPSELTLGRIMCDYVSHLEHHLEQILGYVRS